MAGALRSVPLLLPRLLASINLRDPLIRAVLNFVEGLITHPLLANVARCSHR